MANTATLAVKIVSDSSAARADIGKSSSAVGSFGDRAKKVGNAAGKILAGGLLAAGAAAVKFTQAAAEDAASAEKLANSLKQAAGATDAQVAATEKWIEAQGKALGVADDELRPALSRLATVTGDVGKAQKLAALAMDISAASGKPLKTVVEGLAKAQTGSITGLAKFGVQVKNNAGETKSLDRVMKDLGRTYEGSATKAADTAAGRQKRLQVAMDELQEKIGAKLLPVMEKLIDVGFRVIAWIDKNQKLVGIFVVAVGGLLAVVYTITTAIRIWTAVQAAWNVVMALNPIGIVVLAVIALVAATVIAYKKSSEFRDLVQKVGEIGKAAWDTIRSAAEPVIDVIADLIKWVGDKLPAAWQVAKTLIVGYIKLVTAPMRLLLDVIRVVYGWAKDKIPAAFSTMKDLVKRYMEIVLTPWRVLWDLIKKAKSILAEVPGAVSDMADKVKRFAQKMLSPFVALKNLLLDIWDWIMKILNKIPDLPSISGKNPGIVPDNVLDPMANRRPTSERETTTTINVTVEGGIIGMSDATVGGALLEAINRARRSSALPAIG